MFDPTSEFSATRRWSPRSPPWPVVSRGFGMPSCQRSSRPGPAVECLRREAGLYQPRRDGSRRVARRRVAGLLRDAWPGRAAGTAVPRRRADASEGGGHQRSDGGTALAQPVATREDVSGSGADQCSCGCSRSAPTTCAHRSECGGFSYPPPVMINGRLALVSGHCAEAMTGSAATMATTRSACATPLGNRLDRQPATSHGRAGC